MLILQGVPLCKAAKLQETTEMQRQTNPPGERRKISLPKPPGKHHQTQGSHVSLSPMFFVGRLKLSFKYLLMGT